jgi:hypothetical protein
MRNRRSGARRTILVGLAAVLLTGCLVGDTGGARYVTDEAATLEGLLHSTQTGPAVFWFEYGTTTSYGTSTAEVSAFVAADTATPVSASVDGLEPGTTYHYRLCGVDDDADPQGICGADHTMTTGVGRGSVMGAGGYDFGRYGDSSVSVVAVGDPGSAGYLDGEVIAGGTTVYWNPFDPFTPPVTSTWSWWGEVRCLDVEGNVAVVGFDGAALVVEDNGATGDRIDVIEIGSAPCPEPDPALIGSGSLPFSGEINYGDFVVEGD